MIGPMIGASPYRIGSYRLPFIVVGIFDCSFISLKWLLKIKISTLLSMTSFFFLFLTCRIDKRYFLVLTNLGQAFSLYLIGPSLLFSIPDREWVGLTGVVLLGFSSPSIFAYVIEETV